MLLVPPPPPPPPPKRDPNVELRRILPGAADDRRPEPRNGAGAADARRFFIADPGKPPPFPLLLFHPMDIRELRDELLTGPSVVLLAAISPTTLTSPPRPTSSNNGSKTPKESQKPTIVFFNSAPEHEFSSHLHRHLAIGSRQQQQRLNLRKVRPHQRFFIPISPLRTLDSKETYTTP